MTTTTHSDSKALSFRGAFSAGQGHNVQTLLKLPNVDDINELVKRIRDITDTLSHLLSDEIPKKKGALSEHRKLVDSSVKQFCIFCNDTAALLQIFSYLSHRVVRLLKSIFDSNCHTSIKENASDLRAEIESIYAQIASVEQNWTDFTSQFGYLMRIQPDHQYSLQRSDDMDGNIFHRLDAFWKVVATQLSTAIERRSGLRYSDIGHDAESLWSEYEEMLIGAMDALKQSSDAVKQSSEALKASISGKNGGIWLSRLGRALITFWSRLARFASSGA